MLRRPAAEPHLLVLALAWLLFLPSLRAAESDAVTFRLKNGDRISGFVLSETTNHVVISNRWIKELSLPLAEIAQREKPPTAAGTKTTVATAPSTSAKAKLSPAKDPPPPVWDYWKGEARLGLDILEGRRDRRIYHGRLRLEYEHPYTSRTNRLFRNVFEYSMEYGQTDGEKSSDRMLARDKMDFDITPKVYQYTLGSFGYDRIKKIEYAYDVGAGMGYHLFQHPAFQMNVEGGMSYQATFRTDTDAADNVSGFYYRFAEDFTWKMRTRTTLSERFEFLPKVNLRDYRFRFESTLSHDIWRYLSLSISVVDIYDTQPAPEVDQNELQIRSAIGVKF